MKTLFNLLAILLYFAAGLAWADDPMSKADADARAAMAMAKAKAAAKAPAVAAKTRTIPYADAAKLSTKSGTPIFVAVAAPCVGLCSELRPDFITCHEPSFAGSAKSRYILAVPSKESAGGFIQVEWAIQPKADDVKRELAKWKANRTDARLDGAGELLSLIALGTLAIDAGEYVEWTSAPQVVCENGVCRIVNGVTYTSMPTASGPTVAYPNSSSAGESAVAAFAPRFPRVARLRARVGGGLRQIAGMQPPTIRGAYYSVSTIQPTQAVAPTIAAKAADGPKVVQGPLREHKLIRAYLAKRGVSEADLAAVEAKYGDSGIWAQLLKLFLDEGLPLLMEFLRSLLAAK